MSLAKQRGHTETHSEAVRLFPKKQADTFFSLLDTMVRQTSTNANARRLQKCWIFLDDPEWMIDEDAVIDLVAGDYKNADRHVWRWINMGGHLSALRPDPEEGAWTTTRLIRRMGKERWVGLLFVTKSNQHKFACFKEPVSADEILCELRRYKADLPKKKKKQEAMIRSLIEHANRMMMIEWGDRLDSEDCRTDPEVHLRTALG